MSHTGIELCSHTWAAKSAKTFLTVPNDNYFKFISRVLGERVQVSQDPLKNYDPTIFYDF